jgi:hypothetical protein
LIRNFALILFVSWSVLGCNTNPAALKASKANKSAIASVQLGQGTDLVKTIMRTGPESTAARLLDNGVHEEVWYYLTDYESDTNTAITFHNGKVVAIGASRWLGDGNFPSR